jgi:allophanate hydrolase subunit 2
MTAGLRIEVAPPSTTVQDAGRNDWLHAGVPPSGPLDATAHAAANLAVGNEPRAAAIEIPLGTLHATPLDAIIVSIDGEPPMALAPGEPFVVPAHHRAVRYLAVAGGIAVPAVLGSRATLLLATMGGFHGRALRSGDVAPIADRRQHAPDPRQAAIAIPTVLDPPDPAILRVSVGPQLGRMPPTALAELTGSTWLVSPRSDRVGVRSKDPLSRASATTEPPLAP